MLSTLVFRPLLTSQQLLRHFAGGSSKQQSWRAQGTKAATTSITSSVDLSPDAQDMAHLISRIFIASTGHLRQDRLPVTVDMLKSQGLPSEALCFRNALRRCGVSSVTLLLMAQFSNSSLGHFESTESYRQARNNLMAEEFEKIKHVLNGASFHHPLQRFAGVAFVEMAMALPGPGEEACRY